MEPARPGDGTRTSPEQGSGEEAYTAENTGGNHIVEASPEQTRTMRVNDTLSSVYWEHVHAEKEEHTRTRIEALQEKIVRVYIIV